MKLYSLANEKLTLINPDPFKLEKNVQTLIEGNLTGLFNLHLVKSEYVVENFRIDTLAFDPESKSFVIIEYKKDRNFSVVDQGYTYMSLMLNHKSDFIMDYNERRGGNLKRDDVDWSQSKVMFIAPSFTDYQRYSINYRDMPFELWEITRYENNIVGLLQLKNSSKERIASFSSNKKEDAAPSVPTDTESLIDSVTKEIRVYDEEYHLSQTKVREGIKETYYNLKERVLSLGADVSIKPQKMYIAFKRKTNFLDINFQSDKLWCWIKLKKGELDDPGNFAADVSGKGHYGNGDYELYIKEDSDLDYVMFLINQAYKKQE